ncbi:MarR family transcriptional regulator with acetyltransferase activity [Paraburkholderia unamae]|uniref:bifunctional helix-turn-helix transcriptional regulator/GNAT family N-acetyltransferase n=1 Tax=Paraburkholderia unamae TaxID=219649 RepID=UPI001CB5D2F9|nr:bifunctional helix-turn-helix transcriptional regulator/GNAT family N-acetyltransferase [Paraburkholderia unamae]CAG9269867.1 MarR family transcriptional regulator with acetyltransferase activity [Paraburkholderia unamae]
MDFVEMPAQPRETTILELREFSRRLVRELGFMRTTLADSDLAPSAVHAIIEIGARPGINAKALGEILRLDKSNTSRQVARLEAAGLVKRKAADDARSTELHLSAAGQKLRTKIDRFATDQVSGALRRLVPADQQTLVRALALYADALAHDNPNGASTAAQSAGVQIVEGYRPGCIGDIASLHARFYAANWGFGAYFEKKVATELAAFANDLPAEGRALWLAVERERTLASLAIDGHGGDATASAHLRWFIVDDALRGSGIGRQLMESAMRFVDAHYAQTYLWTFKGLDAARHLYESFGFRLAEECEGDQWGTPVVEQRFVRLAGGAAS